MRNDYQRESTPITTWLISGIVGAFLIQFLADLRPPNPGAELTRSLAFSITEFESGRYWTPLTYWLLHSTNNLLHVSCVVAGVYLFGREVALRLGRLHFVSAFAAGVLLGAATWALAGSATTGALMGASAGVFSLLTLYARMAPQRQLGFLLFFVPLRFTARQLAWTLVTIDALAFVLLDLLSRPIPFAYAPSAHLGGALAGWAYHVIFCWHQRKAGPTPPSTDSASTPLSANSEPMLPTTVLQPGGQESPTQLRDAVDRILDKINSRGLGALTPEERHLLEQAKHFLSRR
jgi:membrane associated rhomboid family serine protease